MIRELEYVLFLGLWSSLKIDHFYLLYFFAFFCIWLNLLEIKPWNLASSPAGLYLEFEIWRLKAAITDLIYWWTFRLLFISFGKQNSHCGINRTLSALTITFLASNSLHNHGGQKWSYPCHNTKNFELWTTPSMMDHTVDIVADFSYYPKYSLFQSLMEWKFWLTGVISTVLIIFGFVGNACAMYILRKPKMRSAFNQLLIILCIIDSMFLLSNIPTTVMALGLRKYLQCIILEFKVF